MITTCQAHVIFGEPSSCDEPATTTVEWMPVYVRASHHAGGNRGRYPHNGSIRQPCCADCAAGILDWDPDWAEAVDDATPNPS